MRGVRKGEITSLVFANKIKHMEDKNLASKQKGVEQSYAIVWVGVLFVVIFVVIGWLYIVRLNFQRIDAKIASEKTSGESLSDFSNSIKNFGQTLTDIGADVTIGASDSVAAEVDQQAAVDEMAAKIKAEADKVEVDKIESAPTPVPEVVK